METEVISQSINDLLKEIKELREELTFIREDIRDAGKPAFLTMKQAMAEFSASRGLLTGWCKDGTIPATVASGSHKHATFLIDRLGTIEALRKKDLAKFTRQGQRFYDNYAALREKERAEEEEKKRMKVREEREDPSRWPFKK